MKLYEITNGFMDLLHNEELTEEEANHIGEELAIALRDKSSDIIGFYLNEKADIEAIDTEIKRLQEMKKRKVNNLERFKEYVKSNMEQLNLQKIETELGKITLAKNPISVEIIDEDKIPEQYKTAEITYKIDKKAIANDYKEGKVIEGVNVHDDNTSLRIK